MLSLMPSKGYVLGSRFFVILYYTSYLSIESHKANAKMFKDILQMYLLDADKILNILNINSVVAYSSVML